MAKHDLRKALSKSSANIKENLSAPDRFALAAKTLESQPTGFSSPAPVRAAAPAQTPVPAQLSSAPATKLDADGSYEIDAAVDTVLVNPFNARRVYTQERILQRAQSIALKGQLVSCLATIRNGVPVLADGEYRLRAVKYLKRETIRLRILPNLSDQDLYEISYAANEEREDNSPIDNALAWRQLLDEKVYPNEAALEGPTGKSAATINKTLQLLKLSDSILELVKADPKKFALSALYELVQYQGVAGAPAALEIAEKLDREEIGRQEITEARQKIAEPKKRKQKETPRQYKITTKEGQGTPAVGFVKEFYSGKISLEITIPDATERAKLMAQLLGRFDAE